MSRIAIISSNDVVESVSREVSKGNGYGIVRASFQIYNDRHDNDEVNGSWQGNVHVLPVQMEYQIQNGRVVPGMLKSGSSCNIISQYIISRRCMVLFGRRMVILFTNRYYIKT